MAIIFGGEAGIIENSFSGFLSQINKSFNAFTHSATGKLQSRGPPPAPIERVHVETGFSNVPGTSFTESTVDNIDDIQTRRITTQEPSLTLYIKKRAFWALNSENDSRFMDSSEKLFMRASKILFEKKCLQIASYEALTKMSSLVSEDAHLDAARIQRLTDLITDFVFKTVDKLTTEANLEIKTNPTNSTLIAKIESQLAELKQNVDKSRPLIQALYDLQNKQGKLAQATNTTWVIDPDAPDVFNMGRGAGVIELTLVNSIDTSLGISIDSNPNEGRVNFSIQDPYGLLRITTDDIEISLAAAHNETSNLFEKDSSGEFAIMRGPSTLLDFARERERHLKQLRENRIAVFFGVSPTALGNSSIPEIIFEISPATYSSKRVAAFSSLVAVRAFDLSTLQVSMVSLPVEQQLTIEEGLVVNEIFNLLNEYADAIDRLNQQVLDANKNEDVKAARRDLRMHYLGKWIIQPMDSVHVYMRGNTNKEGEVIGPLSSLLNNSAFIQNAAKDKDVSDTVLREEMKQFGVDELDIPLEFYKSVRTGSFMRNAGMHVFGGLIRNVSETYTANNGTYVLNVSGTSNLGWLQLSRVNTRPGLGQPNGMLEDPLTPYKFDIDPATGLIKGKPGLLSNNVKAIAAANLKDKHGVYKGMTPTESTLEQDRVKVGDESIPVYRHVPGMVYKWKPGVMVASTDINLERSLKGEPEAIKSLDRTIGLKIVDKPFAGLDAADIVSIIVTGYPHSAERFYKSAASIGSFRSAGSNSNQSYFHSIFDITQTTNRALGNFKPYRAMDLDGSLLNKQLQILGSIQNSYPKIDSLRSKIARKIDERNKLSQSNDQPDDERKANLIKISNEIGSLRAEITDESNKILAAEDAAKSSGIKTNTDDTVINDANKPSGMSDDAHNEMLQSARLKNKILQLRTQYDCKFNEDENLMIISDEYDQNINIQAFITGFLSGDQQLFNSEYKFPLGICGEVANILNFEFFCDSQGHIRFRPPQYNRVPLSLILKMFMLNEKKGIQIYPDFLKSLFEGRLNSTENEVASTDAQIAIWSFLLYIDKTPEELVVEITSGEQKEEIIGGQFLDTSRDSGVNSSSADFKGRAEEIATLSRSVETYAGYKNKLSDITEAEKELVKYNDPNNPNINVIRLSGAKKLKQLLSKKEKLEALLKKLISQKTKYSEGIGEFNKEKINDALAPFENLIEDDYNDFLGPGSSKRFIIHDEQIISSTFTEDSTKVDCRVDILGQHNFIGAPGELVANIPSLWAGATDFDLWRQYGYKSMGKLEKPFLKNAATQCAPYALFLLSRARRDVMRGTITVYGNEYYQLGDVIYINHRDQLFYVTDIAHKFAYDGGQFTTQLTLRYGHTLGDYIPTPFDAIGQGLTGNQKKFNRILVTRETISKEHGIHLGVIKFHNEASDDEHKAMLNGSDAEYNSTALKRSVLMASNDITPADKNEFPKVEIRGWYLDEKDKEKVQKRMNAVIAWLKRPVGRWVEHNDLRYIRLGKQYDKAALSDNQISNLPFENSVEPVYLSKDKDLDGDNLKFSRSPSDDVYNIINPGKASEDRDPTNFIEIVLIKGQEDEEE